MRRRNSLKKLLTIIGEDSGDIHGSKVLEELLQVFPEVEIFGTGGKRFQKLASTVYYNVEELAVIGIWEVLKKSLLTLE